MRLCILLLYLFAGNSSNGGVNAYTYFIKIHFDLPVTVSDFSYNLNKISTQMVTDAQRFFRPPYWKLKRVIDLKLLQYGTYLNVTMGKKSDETVKELSHDFIRSYCKGQEKEKKKWGSYLSVLVTGYDLYSKDSNNKKIVKQSLMYPDSTGYCNPSASCTAIRWNPKSMGYLLAHQIGHSLGMPHDGKGTPCNEYLVMVPEFEPKFTAVPYGWSNCSINAFKTFMKSNDSICVRTGTRKREKEPTMHCLIHEINS